MTPIQFDTGVKKILLVEVPEGTKRVSYDDGLQTLFISKTKKGEAYSYIDGRTIPPGPWQSLGIASDISEEVARGIVKTGSYMGTYWNYEADNRKKSNQMPFAIDSIKSICTLHNLPFERTVILIPAT